VLIIEPTRELARQTATVIEEIGAKTSSRMVSEVPWGGGILASSGSDDALGGREGVCGVGV
jgi:superfamily II DNA/RNA helicase